MAPSPHCQHTLTPNQASHAILLVIVSLFFQWVDDGNHIEVSIQCHKRNVISGITINKISRTCRNVRHGYGDSVNKDAKDEEAGVCQPVKTSNEHSIVVWTPKSPQRVCVTRMQLFLQKTKILYVRSHLEYIGPVYSTIWARHVRVK